MVLNTLSPWVLEHIGTQKIFRLRKGENRIGRNPDCDICLGYNFISRLHAILYVKEDVVLRCWKTLNAVLVNQKEENGQIKLKTGDKISFGVRMYNEPLRERDTIFTLKKVPPQEIKCTSLNFERIIVISDDEEEEDEIRVPVITSAQSNHHYFGSESYDFDTFNGSIRTHVPLIPDIKSERIHEIQQNNIASHASTPLQEPKIDKDNIKNEPVDTYDGSLSDDDRSTIMLSPSICYSHLVSSDSSEKCASVNVTHEIADNSNLPVTNSIVSTDISTISPVVINQPIYTEVMENSGNHQVTQQTVTQYAEKQLWSSAKPCSEDSLDDRPCTSQQAALRLKLRTKRVTFNEPVIIHNPQISKLIQDSSQTTNSTIIPHQSSSEQKTNCTPTLSLNEQAASKTSGAQTELVSTITNQNVSDVPKIGSFAQTNGPLNSDQTMKKNIIQMSSTSLEKENRCQALVPYGKNITKPNINQTNTTTTEKEYRCRELVLYRNVSTQKIAQINNINIEKENQCRQLISYVKINQNKCTDLVPFVNAFKLPKIVENTLEGISLITLSKIKIIELKPKPELSKPQKRPKKPVKRKTEAKEKNSSRSKCKNVDTPPRKKQKVSQDPSESSKNKSKCDTKTKTEGNAKTHVIQLKANLIIEMDAKLGSLKSYWQTDAS